MKDLCVEQDDSPESLALIGEILGAAGVNIEGLCLATSEGRSVIHFAMEDAETARRVLEHSGIRIRDVSEVLVLHKDEKRVTGKPGSFGGICYCRPCVQADDTRPPSAEVFLRKKCKKERRQLACMWSNQSEETLTCSSTHAIMVLYA